MQPDHAPPASRRGPDLERVVADLFTRNGYEVSANALVTGRSGARYEVDVLARRSDALTHTTVGVECKHWAQPVDTAVVARLRLMRDDVSLSEVIVVCPGGAGPAARRAAADHGVDLWDEAALRARLGDAALRALRVPGAGETPWPGVDRAVGGETAARVIRTRARGPWSALTERLDWVIDTWLPLHEVRLDCAVLDGRRRVRAVSVWNTYEAVGGGAVAGLDAPLEVATVDVRDGMLPAHVDADAIRARITRASERLRGVTQPAAVRRHAQRLADDLVPVDAAEVTAPTARTVAWPVTVARLTRGRSHRLVVLDGALGHLDERLGVLLTLRSERVATALLPTLHTGDGGLHKSLTQ